MYIIGGSVCLMPVKAECMLHPVMSVRVLCHLSMVWGINLTWGNNPKYM